MKIYGDEKSSSFKTFSKDYWLFGSDDVLKGKEYTFRRSTSSLFGTYHYTKTCAPKLYLHIPTDLWSWLTGLAREYLLPWRWKSAYLDREDGKAPKRILICTSVEEGVLTDRINLLLGKSLFVTNLIKQDSYDEAFGREYIRAKNVKPWDSQKVCHPFGELVGHRLEFSRDLLCPIYRIRGLFSMMKYSLLKESPTYWKEVTIRVRGITEKVLIKKVDEATISRLGLIQKG